MPEQPLRFYRLLDRLFPRSYAAKFLLVAFFATHLPLFGVGLSFAFNPTSSRTAFLLAVLLATLMGFGVMLALIPRLLAPLELTLKLLEAHLDGSPLPQVSTFSEDTSGQLLRRTSEVLHRLRSSQQRYTALFHAIPDGISCFNRRGEYTEVKLPSYFSYVQPNLVGKTPEELYTPEMAAMIRDRREQMWATGDMQNYELERTLDGHISHREVSIFPLSDDEGAALVRDISKRKQAQQRLQESESRFRSFFENSPNPCLMLESDGVEVIGSIRINQALHTFLGGVPDNIANMQRAEVLAYIESISHPEDWQRDFIYFSEILAGTRDGYRMEKRYLHADGTWRWGDYSSIAIRDKQGNIKRILATIQDITARKHAEQHAATALEQLQVSEAKFRTFFEGSGSAHSIINMQDPDSARDDRILVNSAFTDLMADTVFSDYTIRTFADITALNKVFSHPEDLAIESDYRQALMRGDIDRYRLEKRYLKRNGDTIWTTVHHSLIRHTNGTPHLLVTTVQDITDLKHTQDYLSQTLQRLEQALRTKNMLMREIHHRVKNNLQVIASLLNLQARLLSDTHAKDALSESHKRVMAMAEIHELMHHTDASDQIDFADYLDKLVALMRRSYRVEDIDIQLELSPVTLPLDQGIPLALITNELVSNALKYAFPEGACDHPTITISLQRSAQNVTLCVEDNGVGIDNNDGGDSNSLGMTIVESLSGQLNGTLTFSNKNTTDRLTDSPPQPTTEPTIELIPNHLYEEKPAQDTITDATETGLQVMVRFPLPEARGMST